MTQPQVYGVRPDQEHAKEEFLRDIRPWPTRLFTALLRREGYTMAALVTIATLLVQPALFLLIMPLFLLLHGARCRACRKAVLPMRLPLSWPGPDYGDLDPRGRARKARGFFYLGNELATNEELWISRDDLLTHQLILGTTGSGKTETLVSMAFNYLATGSGLLYLDPKAAPRLAAQLYTMCRLMGRDDDFLLHSYMADKQGRECLRAQGHRRTPVRQSNTQNPFAVGSANQLTQMLLALMPADNGSNAIFSNNAQTLISGLLIVLVELRDRGEMPLSIATVRKYLMSLPDMDALARREDITEKSMLALRAALATVGWEFSRPLDRQPRNFAEQYGYARAYFGRALSLLIDNYGRIFMTTHGEVDCADVITSRRVYVTLIPSMDKDPRELKNLGQICLSSIRNACAVGLGDRVQGRLRDVLGSLPTDARAPFGVIVDEYAAIETPGFEILLTQGRGLGIAVTVASQDFAGIRRASETAAEQIVSNCKVKMFMCTEDPRQTMELVRSLAGEAWVQRTTGWSVKDPACSLTFADNLAVSSEKMARVDFRDLQKQVEGQMTLFFKGGMLRARSFYAAPPLEDSQEVRLANHLKIQDPDLDALLPASPVFREMAAFVAAKASGHGPDPSAKSVPARPVERRLAENFARFRVLPDVPFENVVLASLFAGVVPRTARRAHWADMDRAMRGEPLDRPEDDIVPEDLMDADLFRAGQTGVDLERARETGWMRACDAKSRDQDAGGAESGGAGWHGHAADTGLDDGRDKDGHNVLENTEEKSADAQTQLAQGRPARRGKKSGQKTRTQPTAQSADTGPDEDPAQTPGRKKKRRTDGKSDLKDAKAM